MLNNRISTTYAKGLESFLAEKEVALIASGSEVNTQDGFCGQAALVSTSAECFLANPKIHEEVFGPVSLVVKCKDRKDMIAVLAALKGQLTGTVHAAQGELDQYRDLLDQLSVMVGRIVINGFPTGVEVCHAMVHGGPHPASTDSRFTSVGTSAVDRFLRPVCYQNCPEVLLPEALLDANPLGLCRLINGERSTAAL
jgi:NADP-dependent aldehyde dehydrogenase